MRRSGLPFARCLRGPLGTTSHGRQARGLAPTACVLVAAPIARTDRGLRARRDRSRRRVAFAARRSPRQLPSRAAAEASCPTARDLQDRAPLGVRPDRDVGDVDVDACAAIGGRDRGVRAARLNRGCHVRRGQHHQVRLVAPAAGRARICDAGPDRSCATALDRRGGDRGSADSHGAVGSRTGRTSVPIGRPVTTTASGPA